MTKPKIFREAWHLGHAARLAGKHSRNDNPYRDVKTSMQDFFAWKDGYSAACSECLNDIERMCNEDPEIRADREFMAMRAYWQGLNWDQERFTDSDKNPYCSAQEPYAPWVDAWDQGRRDAKKI